MLILSRKLSESIVIDGRITVRIMRVEGDVVKLGIAAPADVPVHRQEVYDEIRNSNQEAVLGQLQPVPKLSPLRADAASVRTLKSFTGRQAQLAAQPSPSPVD